MLSNKIMCLAIPGKIIKIENKQVKVQYPQEIRTVLLDPNLGLEVGDFVLVQMGVTIKKISAEEAQASLGEWAKFG